MVNLVLNKFFDRLVDYFHKTDFIFWIISLLLSIFSLLLLYSVSKSTHLNYFKTQLTSICVGYLGAYVITKIGYRELSRFWYISAFACFILMLCTFLFGTSVTGGSGVDAKAWIKLPGNITFQPSELAKIGFIITFSRHLSSLKIKEKVYRFRDIVFLFLHALVPMALTHMQGDDGASVIFFCMFLSMCFIAGINLRYFLMLFSVIVAFLPYLWTHILAEYQKKRLLCQLNPEADPLGMGFQQIQGKLSIGSGKLFGLGLFKGPRVENGSVPIQQSDFIFSVIGEELGFIGCVITIALFLVLIFKIINIANNSSDPLGIIVCFGFLGLIVSQTVFNLGMCLSLLPVMGVTLPFLSAGGSSAACLYLGLGLIQSVYMNRRSLSSARRGLEC